jgi:hypothetical protein
VSLDYRDWLVFAGAVAAAIPFAPGLALAEAAGFAVAAVAVAPDPRPVNWAGVAIGVLGLGFKLVQMHRDGCEHKLADMGRQLDAVKEQLEDVLAVVRRFRDETEGIAGKPGG